MSLESWKAEFYPVEAKDCPKEHAALHSLKKWEGLTEENLRRHGLERHGREIFQFQPERDDDDLIVDDPSLEIDAECCALCFHYEEQNDTCEGCPLYEARGGCPCTSGRPDEKDDPYYAFIMTGDAEPMIFWLKKAVELETRCKP